MTDDDNAPHAGGLGDAPIQAELFEMMNSLGEALDEFLNGEREPDEEGKPTEPRKWGFVLQVFPFNDHDGRCNYISNAAREDVVILLREQLRRFEGMAEPPTGHA